MRPLSNSRRKACFTQRRCIKIKILSKAKTTNNSEAKTPMDILKRENLLNLVIPTLNYELRESYLLLHNASLVFDSDKTDRLINDPYWSRSMLEYLFSEHSEFEHGKFEDSESEDSESEDSILLNK